MSSSNPAQPPFSGTPRSSNSSVNGDPPAGADFTSHSFCTYTTAHEDGYENFSHESFLQTTEHELVEQQIQFESLTLNSNDNSSDRRHEDFVLDISHLCQPNTATVPANSLPIDTLISHLG